jgi:hypothetical protein
VGLSKTLKENGATSMTKKIPYRLARNVLLYVALVWLVGTALSVYHHQRHAEYVKQEVRMQS